MGTDTIRYICTQAKIGKISGKTTTTGVRLDHVPAVKNHGVNLVLSKVNAQNVGCVETLMDSTNGVFVARRRGRIFVLVLVAHLWEEKKKCIG